MKVWDMWLRADKICFIKSRKKWIQFVLLRTNYGIYDQKRSKKKINLYSVGREEE